MGAPASQLQISYPEYLKLEQESGARHEFLNGDVWAMAGGSPLHSKLKTNLSITLGVALGDGPCQPYDSDLKVRVKETGLATYPDLSVICGPLRTHPEDANAATNPTLLAEVLSESTEAWDRGEKFAHYRTIPELQHYLLISHHTSRVEHYRRQPDGSWRLTTHTEGETLSLDALKINLSVNSLYRNLPSAPESTLQRS